MSKRAAQKGVTHTHLSFHNARLTKGNLLNKPIDLHAVYTQKVGVYLVECAEQASRGKAGSLARSLSAFVDGKACVGLKREGMHPVESKSCWAPRVTHGTAKLKQGMVKALGSYTPQWSHSYPCPDGSLIQGSRLVVLGSLDHPTGHSHYTPLPQF